MFCAASAALLTFRGSRYSRGYKHAGIQFAPLFGLTHILADMSVYLHAVFLLTPGLPVSFLFFFFFSKAHLHLCAVLLIHFVVLCDQLIRFQAEPTGTGLPFLTP